MLGQIPNYKNLKKEKSLKKGQILFHPTHGICRIRGIVSRPELATDSLCYWIEPKLRGRSTVCFFITTHQLSDAGFHIPASEKQASEVLDYLKNGEKQKRLMGIERVEKMRAAAKMNTVFDYARSLHMILDGDDQEVNRELKQLFKYSIEGLVRELSFTLKLPIPQIAFMIKESLQTRTRLQEWVLKTIDAVEE